MKKTIQIEVDWCDFCQKKQASYHTCQSCKKTACNDCKGIFVTHWTSSRGHGGYSCDYCAECASTDKPDALLSAFREMQRLRHENKGFHDDFDGRAIPAQKRVERLYEERTRE